MKELEAYLVGGAVRDRLLGLPEGDRDWVVVGETPESMQARGFKPVGRDFPVFLHPRTREEYALARTERKVGQGHQGFQFHASPTVTLEEDLVRRDLTINAMAQHPDGHLVDPYNGQADLKARRLRHVSEAFREDPLRVLRVARFAARYHRLGFSVAPETRRLMQEMSSPEELGALSVERVWSETEQALGEPSPQVYVQILRDVGALGVLFPELDRLFGVPQPEAHHPEVDCGVHVLMVLAQAAELSEDPRVRFAALVHDLGKGITPPAQWPAHHGHEAAGEALVREMADRLRLPRDYARLGRMTARWHAHVHRALQLRPATVMKLLEGCDAFRRPADFERFLLACEADVRGREGRQAQAYPQADLIRDCLAAASAITGRDVDGERYQGPRFGEALRRLRITAIEQVLKAREGRA